MHFPPSFYAMYNEKEEKKSYNPAHSHPKAGRQFKNNMLNIKSFKTYITFIA